MRVGGRRRAINGVHGPDLYCKASMEEREEHFEEFLARVGIRRKNTVPALHQRFGQGANRDGYNEHMPNQLHWLQDYREYMIGNITVLR